MISLVSVALVLAVVGFVGLVLVQKFLYICQPNEVLVISGSQRRVGTQVVGYRLVQGGRAFVVPVFEQVDKLDLTNLAIDVKVRGSYSKGGIPLNVDAVANLKIASGEPTIGNAIERFLGKDRNEIIRVAKDTLEGNLRGVLASLTPEEVNQDRVKFAQSLLHEAEADLRKLGLELDTLKIQNVSDDKGYLDSIGRRQTAELIKRSRIAEAENRALSAERDAENLENKEIARIHAEMATLRAEAERRIIDAQTKRVAMVAEQEGEVQALTARTEAELDVQRARIEQVRLQLEAERVKPAEAKKQQLTEKAHAEVAPIIEEGKATAAALRSMAASWKAAGQDAGRIFVAQKLGSLVDTMMSTVQKRPIERVTVIDAKLAEGGASGPRAAVLAEQLKETVGVDVPGLLRGLGPGSADEPRRSEPPPVPKR